MTVAFEDDVCVEVPAEFEEYKSVEELKTTLDLSKSVRWLVGQDQDQDQDLALLLVIKLQQL